MRAQGSVYDNRINFPPYVDNQQVSLNIHQYHHPNIHFVMLSGAFTYVEILYNSQMYITSVLYF